MVLIGWTLLGIALGAVGTELLRASKPQLVKKVEDSARRFADSLCSSKRSSRSAAEQVDEDAENR